MSELFGNTDQPRWINPTDSLWKAADAGAKIGSLFGQSFNAAQDRKLDREKMEFQKGQIIAKEKQDALDVAVKANKLEKAAAAFAGASTPASAWEVASKNPHWLADPDTAPFVKNFLSSQNAVARAENASIGAKITIADNTAFNKELEQLRDPADRASIQSVQEPAKKWQALRIAQQREQIAADNARVTAEEKATLLAESGIASTTITDKSAGVSTRYTSKKETQNQIPEIKILDYDGTPVPIISSGSRWERLKLDKGLTPNQEISIRKRVSELREINDGESKKEISYWQTILPGAKSTSAPIDNAPKVGSVVKGYKFLGGDPADKASWQKVQ